VVEPEPQPDAQPSSAADPPVAAATRNDDGDAEKTAPALRDATAILARAVADEAEAAAARLRYRADRMVPIVPDGRILPLLEPAEAVLAMCPSAAIDRREPSSGGRPSGLAGNLYLTSNRLVLVGRLVVAVDLADIDDAVLSGERLLIAMRDGSGLTVDVEGPRLLRVQLAAARSALRP
jgi:hypothetical protein